MSIDVNKQVKEVTYNGTPLVLVGGGTGDGNIDTGLVPNNGFIPEIIDEDGYITSGTWYGRVISPSYFDSGIADYYTRLVTVNFPNNPYRIGDYAFNCCYGLALTSLPDGISWIGVQAFVSCYDLALTSLPSSLTSIGTAAFYGCEKLAITSIPAGVTTIGSIAFRDCVSLTTITFEGTPTSIESNVFEDCPNLLEINVPWSRGAVANAPWGATYAIINYDYVG